MAGEASQPAGQTGPSERLDLARRDDQAFEVRDEIAASWARCAGRGMAIDTLEVPQAAEVDVESRLAHSARPVLRALEDAVSGEPVSILLSDAEGTVLSRLCRDSAILAALDRVALAPGSVYSEGTVGTNGFGLALADNRTMLVRGAEHYSLALGGYTCAGAPVHDPITGVIVGALSLTTWSQQRSDLLLALADQTAMNIETRLVLATGRDPSKMAECLHTIPVRAITRQGAGRRLRLSRIEEVELEAIIAALHRHRGNVARAAEDLGVSRATMYRKVKRYRIRVEESAAASRAGEHAGEWYPGPTGGGARTKSG